MIITETPRLLLRQFEHDDLDDLAAILADPEVMRFSVSGPRSREQSREWIARCRENYTPERLGFGQWAVIYRPDNKLIGFCGLSRYDDIAGKSETEIGYRFAVEYWGQGFASEAASAVRDYARSELGLTRLISIIEAENMASIRVAEKTGMRYEKDAEFHGIGVRIYAINTAKAAQ